MDEPTPHEPPAEGHSAQDTFAEQLRSKSAGWLLLAEETSEQERHGFDEIERAGFDCTAFRQVLASIRQRALLMHNTFAAQARAHDEMLTAGGPDNPDAYENYRQATEFNTTLLPDD